mgnify:CR=1 FL=1
MRASFSVSTIAQKSSILCTAAPFAAAMRAEAELDGLHLRSSWSTKSKGSIHQDMTGPDDLRSPHLIEGAGAYITELVHRVNAKHGFAIPLHSELETRTETVTLPDGKNKTTTTLIKPLVNVDDTLFRRYPDAKGVLWRPLGACKSSSPEYKRLDAELDGPEAPAPFERVAREKIQAHLTRLERLDNEPEMAKVRGGMRRNISRTPG